MTFKDQPWNKRITRLGDEAETIFETWAKNNRIGFHRSGINRPPFQVGNLPRMVAYTPDYLTEKCYFEVQGFGRDQVVKLKDEKLDALIGWDMIHFTQLWLWNNVTRKITHVPVSWFASHSPDERGMYPEGKPYMVFDAARFPGWVDYDAI